MKNYLISVGLGMIAYVAVQAILIQITMLDSKMQPYEAVIGVFIPVVIALSFTYATAKCK